MLSKLKTTISPYYTNLRGWRTNRKIVVIESDDWGSIRMPSREVYEKCIRNGYRVDTIAYEKFDSIASDEDLELLFDLLKSFRDKNGKNPVITANAMVANPDFEKIRESEFNEYHYELITETFKKYSRHSKVFNLWKQGLKAGVFFPQSHGREHLNVAMFMDALQQDNDDAHFGFKHGMPGCLPKGESGVGNKYVEALKYNGEEDKRNKLEIIQDGLDLFENLFGFRSESFIPPNYIWSSDFDKPVFDKGVNFYQSRRKMKEPLRNGSFSYTTHHIGDINQVGQKYLVRNANFEPSLIKMEIFDPVKRCLDQIRSAFIMKKPAIICSHRVNFVGTIFKSNRDTNLKLLRQLFNDILKKWPDVEFMNSVELAHLLDPNGEAE